MNMFHSRADFCRELWLDYRFPPGGKIRNCFYYKFLKSREEQNTTQNAKGNEN